MLKPHLRCIIPQGSLPCVASGSSAEPGKGLQARLLQPSLPLHDSCSCRPVLQAGEATELGPNIRSTATHQQEPPVQNEYEQDSSDEEVSLSQLLVVVRQWWRLWLRGVKGMRANRGPLLLLGEKNGGESVAHPWAQ